MSDLELFTAPFRYGDNHRDRRLHIRVGKYCSISEQYKIKDAWYPFKDDYGIIEFSIDGLDDLIEQLQRMRKLLMLK